MSSTPILSSLASQIMASPSSQQLRGVTVMVAVSGGADSVALLRLLHYALDCDLECTRECETGGSSQEGPPRRLIVAHYNHRMRGEESDRDESFVRDLSARLGLRCVVGHASRSVVVSPSEDSLRRQRYAFLDQQAHACGARCVTTAHTADDQIETVLHQLFRGTGLVGLSGIRSTRPLGEDAVLIRPLLEIRRHQLRAMLDEIGQNWREDSSNTQQHYRRNWLRHTLLPQVLGKYPAADRAILGASQTLRDVAADQWTIANRWLDLQVSREGPGAIRILRHPPPGTAVPSDGPPSDGAPRNRPPRSAPLEHALPTSQTAIVLGLTKVWDQLRWPRGMMTRGHWTLLVGMIQRGEPRVAQFPGNLRGRVLDSSTVVVETLGGD